VNDWREHAACVDHDINVFFPEKGQNATAAKRICATCTVRVACLNYALDNYEEFGVWGGKSEKERRPLQRIRRSELCGTRSGYVRHWRMGTQACEDCKKAEAEYVKVYRSARRATLKVVSF
jgi:hypothetical protein